MSNDDFNIQNISYQDDFNKEEKPFMPENLVKAGVPFLTNYQGLFGKSPFWFVKNDSFAGIHFNHIQMSLWHIVLHISLLSSIYTWKKLVYDHYFEEINYYFYFMVVIYTTMAISMLRTIFMNPGYLPFFYPAQTDRKEFTKEEFRLGYACQQEQYDWVKKQKRPNRSCFSERVGYIVMRPDHYCGWVTNWIGYRNHRYFIIFTTCASIYVDVIFFNVCHMFYYHRKEHTLIGYILMVCFSAFFGLLFSLQAYFQYKRISINITLLELMKRQVPYYDRGCLNNWSEICGSKKLICLWPFPCISLKPGYNVFNYPEYVGPSVEKREPLLTNEEDKKDKDEKKLGGNDNALSLL